MALAGTVWRPIGPSPLNQSGRQDNGLVTAVAVNPNNGNVVYIGTAGGGVWRTPDGGANWVPIFDRQTSLGIGEPSALAIDPNDTSTIYMGTSGRVGRQVPAGLFKSTDGGASCVRWAPAIRPVTMATPVSSLVSGSTPFSLIQPTPRPYTWHRRRVSSVRLMGA